MDRQNQYLGSSFSSVFQQAVIKREVERGLAYNHGCALQEPGLDAQG